MMNERSIKCPNCGQPAVGSFCSHCGASLTTHAAPKQWNAQTIVPWAAIGISMFALVISISALTVQVNPEPRSLPKTLPQTSSFSKPSGSSFPAAELSPDQQGNQPQDLSTMTPRQAADRLFNRVMMASENGNTQEARQFAPMAVAAYKNLPTMDNDAHYHLALIHLAAGDIKSTRGQLDKLRRAVPEHLLGLMVEHQLAEKSSNKDSAIESYKNFLAAYESEILVDRAEYKDHQKNIDRFHKKAQASLAGKK